MNKNGFIATSIMYSFFIVFALLALLILGTYSHYRILNEKMNQSINSELNQFIANDSNFDVGDYVKMIPTKTSYSISASDSGYPSSQTINPSELQVWRVIKINDDNTIDAISEYASSNYICFNGITAYTNYIRTLQTIADQYANDLYTSSARMMGYDNQTLVISNPKAYNGTINTVPSNTSTSDPTTGTGQEYSKYSSGDIGDTLYLSDYQLVSDIYKDDTSKYGTTGLKTYNVSATTSSRWYWLSSRKYVFTDSNNFSFIGRCINSNGSLNECSLRRYSSSSWSDNAECNSFRPIITLKSNVNYSSGDGTFDNPYVLS